MRRVALLASTSRASHFDLDCTSLRARLRVQCALRADAPELLGAAVDGDERRERLGAVPPAELRAGDDPGVLVEPVRDVRARLRADARRASGAELRAVRAAASRRAARRGRPATANAAGRCLRPASRAGLRSRRLRAFGVAAARPSSSPRSSWSRVVVVAAGVGVVAVASVAGCAGPSAEASAAGCSAVAAYGDASSASPVCAYAPFRFSVRVMSGAPVSITRVPAAGDCETTVFAA